MSDQSTATRTIRGVGVSAGIAIGRAIVLRDSSVAVPHRKLSRAGDISKETERLKQAMAQSHRQLSELRATLPLEGEQASIIEAYMAMAADPVFLANGQRIIQRQKINAEWAVQRLVSQVAGAFDGADDDYLKQRRNDVEFLGQRILRNLTGHEEDDDLSRRPLSQVSIIVAKDLSPADATVLLRRSEVKCIVTERGAKTSHLAILARARGIPCVVDAGSLCATLVQDDLIAVDGLRGEVVISPDAAAVEEFQRRRLAHQASETALRALRDLPAVTLDNASVRLMGNAENAIQLPVVLSCGAQGVGLFRTEFLFLDRKALPDEEEQYSIYAEAIRRMEGRTVTFRTLDLGADKLPRRGNVAHISSGEPNPALGLRGIRYCLRDQDVFLTQLRAILRASARGPARLLLPMITEVTEVRQARDLLKKAKDSLVEEGLPFDDAIQLGGMVETPAAAWSADRLAGECDFFSIGTNDLVQYALALDRQNSDVTYLYSPLHLSVLRAIQATVKSGKAAGIPVAMCGEMAGDPDYVFLLLGMGLDELSMAARQIPKAKRIIRASRLDEAKEFAERVMSCDTSRDAEEMVRQEMTRRFSDFMGE